MRYNVGNNTEDNWARAQSDLEIALSSQYLLQSRVVGKNGTGSGGPWGLINATGAGILSVDLPWNHANGSAVRLGDEELGFPPSLYPNLTYHAEVYNSTVNVSKAAFKEQYINSSAPLFLGPLMVNESFALCSITVPIINNTSHVEVLGWITVVVNADLFFQFRDTDIGLGNSGVVLLIGPANPTSKLPANIPYNSMAQADQATIEQQRMRYILPPKRNSSRSLRHSDVQYGKEPSTFTMAEFPAVRNAATVKQPLNNNAGSLLDTNNDEGDHVAVGFSLPPSVLVDWIVVIESAYDEVYQPITNLRNVLIACLFGTTGAVLLLLFPVAHYSVRPIRLLRDATKKSVDPYDYSDHSGDHGNVSESPSRASDGLGRATSPDEENLATIAKKEGMMSRLTKWRTGNKKQALDKPRTRDGRFRIPGKVKDRKHFINDELTDLTRTFNEMSEELQMQYARLEERVRERTAELELSKKAAEAANESKTLFIANISHELKTPLNGILGMCAVCLHEDDPTKIKRSLGIIYKSGDLLLNLLTDLLTFSKNQIGQQQLTLDEKEFRLADVSAQILSIFDKQAKEASIKLSVLYEGPNESLETASGTPAHAGYGPYGTGRVKDMYLWGDQHRILQVVINLVSNSL